MPSRQRNILIISASDFLPLPFLSYICAMVSIPKQGPVKDNQIKSHTCISKPFLTSKKNKKILEDFVLLKNKASIGNNCSKVLIEKMLDSFFESWVCFLWDCSVMYMWQPHQTPAPVESLSLSGFFTGHKPRLCLLLANEIHGCPIERRVSSWPEDVGI